MAVFAKGVYRESHYSLHEWEYMEGTDDLTAEEAEQFIKECITSDKQFDHRYNTTLYKYREMTYSQLLDAGHIKNRGEY